MVLPRKGALAIAQGNLVNYSSRVRCRDVAENHCRWGETVFPSSCSDARNVPQLCLQNRALSSPGHGLNDAIFPAELFGLDVNSGEIADQSIQRNCFYGDETTDKTSK